VVICRGGGSVQFRGAVLDFCVSGVLGWGAWAGEEAGAGG
jgi:hypothetical protein